MAVTFLTNEDEKKYVKTINDTAPDENGNIVVKGEGIAYDNTVSGIDATTVQGAIDKLSGGNVDETFIVKVLEEYLKSHPIDCGIKPIPKTDTMTQPVGIDENGMLWVAPIGSSEPGKYTVTSLLNKVESNRPSAIVTGGESYTATLTAADGYEIGKVIVTMGGVDITAEVYADGTINIPTVTGDVIITASAAAVPTDIMSKFKYLGPTTYSPGTYTAWCPTGLIYDESRDVYAHFMNVQAAHYQAPNACELWFNTIDPETLEHTKPVFIARTAEALTSNMVSSGALGCCIKDGKYYMFSRPEIGYYSSEDGGATWEHKEYETAPDACPWGCYVLGNGRMIMGSDTRNHKVYYSDDNGKNWTIVQSENFNEPTFIDFGGGTLMAICRENMDSANNIQKPWMHISNDYGATWTASVTMETVGYMGNNNCNAYVHDNYVELFVGSRGFTNSPQYDGTTYEIRQYAMDLSKGAVDDFEYVSTVYKCMPDDNPQGLTGITTADDFSTPCIAIKDKSHSLLTFYAPIQAGVTHHLIAVGNVPVDDFEIPSIIPESYNASQTLDGTADNSTVTVCGGYTPNKHGNYPSLYGGYLKFDDIEDGGFVHVQVLSIGFTDASNTSWRIPAFVHVKDGVVRSRSTSVSLGRSPVPNGVTAMHGIVGKVMPVMPNNAALDIYGFIDGDVWWTHLNGTWIRVDSGDCNISNLAYQNSTDTPEMIPNNIEGLTNYKILGSTSPSFRPITKIEYDKASV